MIRLMHVEPNAVRRTVLEDMLAPDVLLIALGDGIDGLEALRRWHDAVPGTRVLALLADGAAERVPPILQAGIEGVLLTEHAAETTARATALVAMGERVIPPRLVALLGSVQAGAADADKRGPYGLTANECVILAHLREGFRNQRIAALTGQDEPGIKVQIHAIFRKLRVRNRAQAALWAARNSHLLLSFGGVEPAGMRRSG